MRHLTILFLATLSCAAILGAAATESIPVHAAPIIRNAEGTIHFLPSELFEKATSSLQLQGADALGLAEISTPLAKKLRELEHFRQYFESRSGITDGCLVRYGYFNVQNASLLRHGDEKPELELLAARSPYVAIGEIISLSSGFFPEKEPHASRMGTLLQVRFQDQLASEGEPLENAYIRLDVYNFWYAGKQYCVSNGKDYFQPEPGTSILLLGFQSSSSPTDILLPHLIAKIENGRIVLEGASEIYLSTPGPVESFLEKVVAIKTESDQ